MLLDFHLAELYDVETKALNQAVSRNTDRFPADFMFRLNPEEFEYLNRSQIVTGSQKHRDPKYLPRAFTQEGIAMLSSVLRSDRAIQVNIAVMRAFVKMREFILTNRELALRLDAMESHYDNNFKVIFDALRDLMKEQEQPKHPIGFVAAG